MNIESNRKKSNRKNSLVEVACAFWFVDNDQVRSPFPTEIQAQARRGASAEYDLWLKNLTTEDRAEVDEDELVRVFEMLLFSEGVKLVGTDDPDQVLTLHHPLMPRIGDIVNDAGHGPSRVVERRVEKNDDDKPQLIIALETEESGTAWESAFELPP